MKNNDSDLVYQAAEDTFLKDFCTIARFEWGSRYCWPAGGDWPKFNFIRFNGPAVLSESELTSVLQDSRQYFASHAKGLCVKWAPGDGVDAEMLKGLTDSGSGLCHYRYEIGDKVVPGAHSVLDVRECQNDEDLRTWWLVNSSGRSRENAFSSPLWPVVQKKFSGGTRFFLYRVSGNLVAGSALDEFEAGLNHWGLAVVPDHKLKGYSSMVLNALAGLVGARVFHGQTVIGEVRDLFHQKRSSLLMRCEARYE